MGGDLLLAEVELGRIADPLLALVHLDQVALLRWRAERDVRRRGSGTPAPDFTSTHAAIRSDIAGWK